MEKKCDCLGCKIDEMLKRGGIVDYLFFWRDDDRTFAAIATENCLPGCLLRMGLDEVGKEDSELADEIRSGLQARKPSLRIIH